MDINQNTVVIVTGGASGLGAATARVLAAKGAKINIFDMNPSLGEAIADTLGADFYQVDVSDATAVAAAVKAVEAKHKALHILVNCAGIGTPSKTVSRGEPHDPAIFAKVIGVNLLGSFNCASQAAAAMLRSEPVTQDGGRGVIINTASVAAYEGQIGQVAYSATKGGVIGMTIVIARDLAELGIRCNTIVPGLIHTPMFDTLPENIFQALENSVLNPQRLGKPDEIAKTAQYLVENDYVNGECIRMDGGIRMTPR